MNESKELKEYKEKLNNHDWFYDMSDDPRVFEDGRASYRSLIKEKTGKPDFEEAFKRVEDNKISKLFV